MSAAALHVFCDFDGTVTEPDTLKLLVERLGGGPALYEETGRLLRMGALTLREGIARDVGSVRVPFAEAAAVLRAEVAIDPGFAPFARWCAGARVPLTILSAGFEEIIHLLLGDLLLGPPGLPPLEVRANRLRPGTWTSVFRDETPWGHDKAAPIRTARRRGATTVLVGDGYSDREAARVADVVLARRGRSLATYCRERGIPCREYATFDDVLRDVRDRLRPAA
jgi:HAD superfamily phosphoserine phosphatase-like hydrolase